VGPEKGNISKAECAVTMIDAATRVRVTLQLTQSVGLSWCLAPSGARDQICIYVL
jgi:hypothetical protein